ncbi:MAG: hypothetical protein IPK79_04480 [Vampirovibrionales bacterium]|nr:hypothetical protein [Vampirovibrionales bacterium]
MSNIRKADGLGAVPKQHEVAKREVAKHNAEAAQATRAAAEPAKTHAVDRPTAHAQFALVGPQITRTHAGRDSVREEGLPRSVGKAVANKNQVDIAAILGNLDTASLHPSTLNGLQTLNFS